MVQVQKRKEGSDGRRCRLMGMRRASRRRVGTCIVSMFIEVGAIVVVFVAMAQREEAQERTVEMAKKRS